MTPILVCGYQLFITDNDIYTLNIYGIVIKFNNDIINDYIFTLLEIYNDIKVVSDNNITYKEATGSIGFYSSSNTLILYFTK